MSESAYLTYYQRNRDVTLNRAKDYYKIDKQIKRRRKNKKREYGKSRYHNMPEEKKQRLKEHQKNYREAKKYQHNMNKIVF